MITVFQTLGSFILVLGILVFVHEFGHFLVAKLLRIGVPVFSLGFGPRVLGFRRGGTDYRISAVPLGGYVRMVGDESDENRTGAPEEFLSRPKWHRFLVFVAGAVFNVILALLLSWMTLWAYGQEVVDTYPLVGQVIPGSNADRAGVEPGDRILEIEGRDARETNLELEEILMAPDTVKTVVLERGAERLEIRLETGSDPTYRMGFPGWDLIRESPEPTIVAYVLEGEPAHDAGLQPGDRVLGADDQFPIGEVALRALLAASAGTEIVLRVQREERELDIAVTPRQVEGRGRIGVQFYTMAPREELGAVDAFRSAVRRNMEWSSMLFLTLKKFARGEISPRAFSGPIEIARFSRQALRSGLESFLTFLAFISLQLGILNLLPIPVLDGGHILILGVEGVMRRDLSDRIKERVMQAGLIFLLAFVGIILYLDVIKAWFS